MRKSSIIKVVIVEDIKDVREGLKYFLKLDPQVKVLKTFPSAEDLLIYLEKYELPDIILMDIVLPKMTGIEATGIISEKYKGDAKITLSTWSNKSKTSFILSFMLQP